MSLPNDIVQELKDLLAREHRLSYPKGAEAEKLKQFAQGQRSGYVNALIDLGFEADAMRVMRDEKTRLNGRRVVPVTDKDLKGARRELRREPRKITRMKQRIVVPGNRYFPGS